MSPEFAPPSRRKTPMPLRGTRLGDLASELGHARITGDPAAADVIVTGVRQDSRAVAHGDLFVARRGHTVDGARFVPDAIARGAVAVLADRGVLTAPIAVPVVEVDDAQTALAVASASVYGHPTFSLDVVGITGTNGKTTTSLLVRAVIDACGGRCGVVGTLGYTFEDLALPATHTSPEADELARVARQMRDRGASHLVMEVSSIAIAARRVDAVRFRVAAFTNLTQDHLDVHGTMEAYAEAKARLFTELGPSAAAVQVDSEVGREIARRFAKSGRLYRISTRVDAPASEAEIAPLALASTSRGTQMRVRTPAGELSIDSPLLGAHNAENLLTALAIALLLDLDPQDAAAALHAPVVVPGRLERCDDPSIGDDVVVLVDYAHTPDALERALASVRPLTSGRVHCVFGCGGDRDTQKRPLMGAVCGRGADVRIVTNDNPRSEDPRAIAASVVDGLDREGAPYVLELDRRAAIRLAVDGAAPGDVVLVAGKGHETYQVIGSVTTHFDDREESRAALTARRARTNSATSGKESAS
jgi:UDP-N-acetylmuramoyl-L-alanyl-D-glutamate--2,6-diaminopimelate ligase